MFVSREGSDTCIAIIRKCGNTSIHQAVLCAKPVVLTNEEALNYKNRVAFIRHPIDRLHSIFFNARGVIRQNKGWCDISKEDIFMEGRGRQADYEAFIDHMLVNEDEHWKPQTEILSHNGGIIPNIFHPLSELDTHYYKYFNSYQKIAHSNSWIRKPLNSYKEDTLKAKYVDDFALWNSLGFTWP